ncbi:MAG TPA: phage replisome organizer N-terminal domain-containing protein [Clostridia bacterium]
MSDNKKYYYLKLKENFFEEPALELLESLENGYIYSNILLKLYLKSLRNEGRLAYNDRIPYNSKIIAQMTKHNIDVVEKAIRTFKELELIEILDNGAIYMLDIQNFIGESSTEGDRKRSYRNRINKEKSILRINPQNGDITNIQEGSGQMSVQMSCKCPDEYPPEIRDKSIDNRYKSIDIKDKNNKLSFDENSIEYSLSFELKRCILKNNPNAKVPDNLQKWANDFNKIIRIDKRSEEDLRLVIKYSQSNTFWRSNILSPSKLRDKFDTLYLQSKNVKESNISNVSKFDKSKFLASPINQRKGEGGK